MNPPADLAGWLALLETRHPQAIDLGLARVARVREAMGLTLACPVITVAGTNGKGSTCAYLEAMLLAAGYRVGCYTSPHLLRYNERVRIDAQPASDALLVDAFRAVEQARGDVSLTYFEHGTLAAAWLFARAGVAVAILEVGMGGRLDAVNIFDADCAVITPIDLDHQAYLGDTREAIGFEKAGILRPGRAAVCTDPAPPQSLRDHACAIGAHMAWLGEEIQVETAAGTEGWQCRIAGQVYAGLPRPGLAGRYQLDNAAGAIAALAAMRAPLPVPLQAIRTGIASARPPGRFQVIGQGPRFVLDVSHNPHGAHALASNLGALRGTGRVLAVLAMLADKDVTGVVRALALQVDVWHAAGLTGARALSGRELAERLGAAEVEVSGIHASVGEALTSACAEADPADIILIFGSFHTVAAAWHALQTRGLI